jgi:hypothetical protein
MATQPYFFYSNKCANCSQVIETLKGLNKAGLYKFILVESLPRNQIPSFLKKVPTLYIPETKEVIVGKAEIFAHIAKPTNSRKELPVKDSNQSGVASGGSNQQIIGDISAWGFEGQGGLTETYSSWDNPSSFTASGGSMYTFLNDSPQMASAQGAGMPSGGGVASENTIKSKTGSNDDVAARMAAMEEQRKKEFGGVSRQ